MIDPLIETLARAECFALDGACSCETVHDCASGGVFRHRADRVYAALQTAGIELVPVETSKAPVRRLYFYAALYSLVCILLIVEVFR